MDEPETYRRRVTELVEAGWRIEAETADRVTLVNREVGSAAGHLLVAVLTIWWTMGVGNLLYGAYKYLADSERTVVWKDGPEEPDDRAATELPAGDAGGDADGLD